ncbi:MAG: hypothetical protein V2I27_04550 [Erythrobacter sp.]|jgi:hypothetical protein|nr:hypothetical protein [Erythrobacter sp.]
MIFRLAALGAVGAVGYSLFRALSEDQRKRGPAAYSKGEPDGVRNAGADATRTKGDVMSEQDEALDETFPASDPVAKY